MPIRGAARSCAALALLLLPVVAAPLPRASQAPGLEHVLDACKELGARIAKMSPLILKILKRTLNAGGDMPLSAALAHEQSMASLVLDSEDAHEGCSAFLEKRRPNFTQRA